MWEAKTQTCHIDDNGIVKEPKMGGRMKEKRKQVKESM
jgi:hypothetical protein